MFKGSMPALVTPFRNFEIDFETLSELVEWQINEGSSGIVPVGTTGESPTLSEDEHKLVVEAVVAAARGRVPVVAGAGSNDTEKAIRYMRAAERAGASAALVVTPYYNNPTLDGLVAHFKVLHDCCELPIFIYNIPGRSVVDLTPAVMGELSKLPRIIGVKDATGKVDRVSQQRAACGKNFIQLSAEDASSLGFNAQGGMGCISVTANVAPRLCADFQAACQSGNFTTALDLHDRLMPLHEAIFLEPGVVGAKYGLSLLNRCEFEVRLPLVAPSVSTRNAIQSALNGLGLTNG